MERLDQVNRFFKSKGVDATVVQAEEVYPLSRFSIELGDDAQVSHVEKYSRELGLELKSLHQPIFKTNYSEGVIEAEVMLDNHPTIRFENLINSLDLSKYILPCLLGTEDVDSPFVIDLQKAPHILIGGSTGSGKSMMLHCAISSLMRYAHISYTKFLLFDPKHVEFSAYKKSKHLCGPIITSGSEANDSLKSLVETMESRLGLLSKLGVRNVSELPLKKRKKHKLNYIVCVIDELSDLFVGNKHIKKNLQRLLQKCRSSGIHFIVATQHPSAKVVPGELKANLPYVVGCRVASAAHSRVLFEQSGAERLLGNGDALVSGGDYNMSRFKGALVESSFLEVEQKTMQRSFFARIFKKY